MRIVFVVHDLIYFITHRLPLAVAARDEGWEVHVVSCGGDEVDLLLAEGLIHHRAPFSSGKLDPIREMATIAALIKLFGSLRPALVHNIAIKAIIYGGIAARLSGVPAVVSAVSGLGYTLAGNGWKKRLIGLPLKVLLGRLLRRPGNAVIFQTKEDRAMFLQAGLLRREAAVLIKGAGVNLKQFTFSPEPPGLPVVVLASRMIREKGLAEFVEAARIINRDRVRACFVLAGRVYPSPTAVSQEQLEAWRDSRVVDWVGLKWNMPEILAGCHIVCLPTFYGEGVPKILLEAAACGRAVVTTDIPGCRDVVRPGVNGLLIPPRDVPALVKALITLLENPDLRRKMGTNGRQMAEKEFDQEKAVSQTVAIYKNLIDKKPARQPGTNMEKP